MESKLWIATLLWILGLTQLSVQREGDVILDCSFDLIRVKITDYLDLSSRLNAVNFYVGEPRFPTSNRCYGGNEIHLYSPFQICGMGVKKSDHGVEYSNTLWAITTNNTALKFADIKCRYGAGFQDLKPPAKSGIARNTTSWNEIEVNLCKTPYYCPSGSCPIAETFTDHVVFFNRDVIHLSMELKRNLVFRNQLTSNKVAAIESLVIWCSDEAVPSRVYHSVEGGCNARKYFGNPFARQKLTLGTQVNYNVHSDTICLSVDVPPVEYCPKFFIQGSIVQCDRNMETKCEDYSGSRCTGVGAMRSNFTFGPVHVTPRNVSASMIYYYDKEPRNTTALPETKPSGDIEQGQSQVQAAGVDVENPDPEEIEPGIPAGRSFVNEDLTRKEEGNGPNLTDTELTVPEYILRRTYDSVTKSTSNRDEAEITATSSPSSGGWATVNNVQGNSVKPTSAKITSKPLQVNPSRNHRRKKPGRKENRKRKPNRIASDADGTGLHSEQRDGQHANVDAFEEATTLLTDMDVDHTELDITTEPANVPFLARFNADSANDGFIWGALSALGIFLLVAIGLVVAWVANKRKKSRRQAAHW